MNRLLISAFFALLFSVSITWAGPFEDFLAANARGDYSTMLRIVRPQAEKGEAWAQHVLGEMYTTGEGVTQHYGEAVKWFRRAAAQGILPSQYNLAVMYNNGEGVAQDYVRAHMWWNLAAAKGDGEAAKRRDAIAKLMTPQQIAEAQTLARGCQARNFKGCD